VVSTGGGKAQVAGSNVVGRTLLDFQAKNMCTFRDFQAKKYVMLVGAYA
jgi:hypothetical protein